MMIFCLKSIKSHNNIKTFLYIIFLSIILSSCSEEPFPRCIDADDFGNIKFSLSANRARGHGDFKFNNGDSADKENANQVIRWRKTGYTTTGETLIVRTAGEWTSWLSDKNKKLTSLTKLLDDVGTQKNFDSAMNLSIVNKNRKCNPYFKKNLGFGGNAFYFYDDQGDKEISGQYNAPCWFTNGWGLNILFKRPGDPDPNSSEDIARYPHSPTVHAYYLGYGEPDVLNTALSTGEYKTNHAFGIDGNSGVFGKIKIERDWEIYVKITDRYYYDNAGGYIISFIKGVTRPAISAVFETIRYDVETKLSGAVQKIYTNIVSNRQFRQLTLMMIAIFIAANGYFYILGLKEYKQGELVIIILKLLFLGFLLEPNSWLFFNEFIFKFIRDIINFMIATVNSQSIGTTYNSAKPFLFLDEIIANKLFSGVVWNGKIFAILINNIFGVVAAFMIIIILLIYLILVMYGFVLYILGYFVLSLLFCLFPIFFVFGLLIPQCSELLTNWLTQIFSYFLQMIFYFALLGLISAAIMNSYYRIMGFTICYNQWLSLDFGIWKDSYSHFTAGTYFTPHKIPVPKDQAKAACVFECKDECESGKKVDACKDGCDDKCKDSCDEGDDNCKIIERKPRYKFTKGIKYMLVPPDYTEYDYRYADYPYYDPDLSNNVKIGGGISGIPGNVKNALEVVFNDISSIIYSGTSDRAIVVRTLDHLKKFLNNDRSLDSNIKEVLLKLTSDAQAKFVSGVGDSGFDKIKRKLTLLTGLINRKYTQKPDANSAITESDYDKILNATITAIAGKNFTNNDKIIVNSGCDKFKKDEFENVKRRYSLDILITNIRNQLGKGAPVLILKDKGFVYDNKNKSDLEDKLYENFYIILAGSTTGNTVGSDARNIRYSKRFLSTLAETIFDKNNVNILNDINSSDFNSLVHSVNSVKLYSMGLNSMGGHRINSRLKNKLRSFVKGFFRNDSEKYHLYDTYDRLLTYNEARKAPIVPSSNPKLQPISDLYRNAVEKQYTLLANLAVSDDYDNQIKLATLLSQIAQSLKDNGLDENYFGDLNTIAVALAEAGHRGERISDLCNSLKGYGGASGGNILDNHDFVSNLEGALDWSSNPESNILGTGDDAYIIEKIIQRGQMYATGEIFALALVVVVLAMSFDTVPRVAASIAGASPYSSTLVDVFSGFFNPQSGSIIGSKIGGLVSGLQSKLQDKMGRGLDISSHASRAGTKIASALAHKLDKTAANSKNPNVAKFFAGGIKLIGSGVKSTINVTRIAFGMESDISQNIRMKHNLRHIRYARAVVGRHLGLFSVSGVKYFISKGIEHNVDKYLLDDNKEFKEKLKDIYSLNTEAIHNYILGISKIKDDFRFDNDEKDEDINPFADNKDKDDDSDDKDDDNEEDNLSTRNDATAIDDGHNYEEINYNEEESDDVDTDDNNIENFSIRENGIEKIGFNLTQENLDNLTEEEKEAVTLVFLADLSSNKDNSTGVKELFIDNEENNNLGTDNLGTDNLEKFQSIQEDIIEWNIEDEDYQEEVQTYDASVKNFDNDSLAVEDPEFNIDNASLAVFNSNDGEVEWTLPENDIDSVYDSDSESNESPSMNDDDYDNDLNTKDSLKKSELHEEPEMFELFKHPGFGPKYADNSEVEARRLTGEAKRLEEVNNQEFNKDKGDSLEYKAEALRKDSENIKDYFAGEEKAYQPDLSLNNDDLTEVSSLIAEDINNNIYDNSAQIPNLLPDDNNNLYDQNDTDSAYVSDSESNESPPMHDFDNNLTPKDLLKTPEISPEVYKKPEMFELFKHPGFGPKYADNSEVEARRLTEEARRLEEVNNQEFNKDKGDSLEYKAEALRKDSENIKDYFAGEDMKLQEKTTIDKQNDQGIVSDIVDIESVTSRVDPIIGKVILTKEETSVIVNLKNERDALLSKQLNKTLNDNEKSRLRDVEGQLDSFSRNLGENLIEYPKEEKNPIDYSFNDADNSALKRND